MSDQNPVGSSSDDTGNPTENIIATESQGFPVENPDVDESEEIGVQVEEHEEEDVVEVEMDLPVLDEEDDSEEVSTALEDYTFLPDLQEEDDEGEAESAFLEKYNEEFSNELEGDNANIPPRVPVSEEALEGLIRKLEEDEGTETEEEEEEIDILPAPPPSRGGLEPKNAASTKDQKKDGVEPPQVPDGKLLVLGPDHPKMIRFQEALKRHLLKQIYLEEAQLRKLEGDLKLRHKEREEMGEQLYNLEFELQKQTDSIERSEKEIAENSEKTFCFEEEIERSREHLERAHYNYQLELKEEEKLEKAMKEMDIMEWCIRQAVKDFESERKVNQRADDKFQKLKIQLELDKRDQDVYLEKIMIRLQQAEQSNASIKRQIQAHQEEHKELNSYIAEASTEIEALQIERNHLQRAWNETLNVVRTRDEALNAARKIYDSTVEDVKNIETEIKSYTKAIAVQQEEHERGTVRLKRRKMEERQLQSRISSLEQQLEELKRNLMILQETESGMKDELTIVTSEIEGLEKVLDVPRQRIQKMMNEKKEIQDKMLLIFQEQETMNNVAQGLTKQIREARQTNREVEIEISKLDHELTQLRYESEVIRTETLKKRLHLAELEKKLKAQEYTLQTHVAQLRNSERIISKKNNEAQSLSVKLKKLQDEQESLGVNKLEEEVQELEKAVLVTRNACVDVQEKWLKLQDELVTLTGRRDQLLSENDLRRKEEFILDRKRQRINTETLTKQAEVQNLQKSIKQCQMDINLLNSKLYEGKEEQESINKENSILQDEISGKVKDGEAEILELQEEIARLEREKERLHHELSDSHEECLQWEKKLKVAKELRENIKKEQQTSIAQLKSAIHHMQVRYNELRRAQDKLMADLERCLDKRERIIQQSELTLKKKGLQVTENTFNKKREEVLLYEKYRRVLKELQESENEIKSSEDKLEQLRQKTTCEIELLKKIKKTVELADTKLCDAAVAKHKNLIEIIMKQIKYKTLEAVAFSRVQMNADPKVVDEEIRKIEEKSYSIVELCDNLLEQFPEYKFQIKLIKATILSDVK